MSYITNNNETNNNKANNNNNINNTVIPNLPQLTLRFVDNKFSLKSNGPSLRAVVGAQQQIPSNSFTWEALSAAYMLLQELLTLCSRE